MPRDTVHPGKILWEEFMQPEGVSVAELSDALGVPDTHIQAIIDRRCGVSDIMAIRLAKYFNTSQLFWTELQSACELAA